MSRSIDEILSAARAAGAQTWSDRDWFQQRPEVQRQYFYGLPRPLFQLLERAIRPSIWTSESRQLEEYASARFDGAVPVIGYWNGAPLQNEDVLPPTPMPTVDQATIEALGWNGNDLQINQQIQTAQIRLDYFSNVARGYAGWLLTNPEFQTEQAALISQWSDQIR
jgi:hypothetical protein